MRFSSLAIAAALLFTSACVVVPVTPPTTGTPTGGNVENWDQTLRGRTLVRAGETINFFSDGSFAWQSPQLGQSNGVWTGGPNRLCIYVQNPGREQTLCGVAYLTNGQLEYLADNGGAPIYWNIR